MSTLLNEGFVTLLAVSLGAGLLGLAAFAMTPLLRNFGAHSRYLLWMLLFLALLVPLRPSLGNSLIHIALPANLSANDETTAAAVMISQSEGTQSTIASLAQGSGMALEAPVAVSTETAPSDLQTWFAEALQDALRVATPWLGALWLAGVLILAGYQLWRHMRFVRTVRRWSEPARDPQLNALYQTLLQEMEIKRAPRLALCAGVRSPLLYGFVTPTILLPTQAIPHDEVALILRHELIHHQRGDLWWRALILLATALHWFNPAVYIMALAAAAECEISCDERLLRGMDARERRRYGEAILGVVRTGGIPQSALTTTFYGGKQGMKTRIEAIMDTSTKRTGIAVLLMMVLAILSTGALFAADPAQEPVDLPVAPASPPAPVLPTLPEGATSLIIRSENGVTEMSTDGGETWQSVPEGIGFAPLLDARGAESLATAYWLTSTEEITGVATLSGTTLVRPADLALPALPTAGVRVITSSECEAEAAVLGESDDENDGADAPPVLCITSITTATAALGDGAAGFYLAQPLEAGELSTHAIEIRSAETVPAEGYAPGVPVPAYGVYAVPGAPAVSSVPAVTVQGGSVMAVPAQAGATAVTVQGGTAMAVPAQTFEVMRAGSADTITVLAVPAAVSGTVTMAAPTILSAPSTLSVPVAGSAGIVVAPSTIARDAEGSATIYVSPAIEAAPGAPVIVTRHDDESAPVVGAVIEAVPAAPSIAIERGSVDASPAAAVPLLAPESAIPFTPAIADYEEVGIFADEKGALTFAGRPVRLLVDNGPEGQFSLTFEGTENGIALRVERDINGELVGVRIIK